MKPPFVCVKIDTVNSFLKMIPQDFPITERPYEEMAANAGVSEEEFLERLEKLKKESVIRRVAAILYHRKVLYTHNAMVVWKVDENETERIGWVMASFPEVSHCYERDNGGFWEYTLYTMIHGKNMDNCMDTVRRISEKTGIKEFEIFLSKREFKKTSLSVEEDVRLDYSV